MRRAALLMLAAAALTPITPAQEKPKSRPTTEPTDIKADYRKLTQRLAAPQELRRRGQDAATCLREFCRRFEKTHPDAPELLRARSRLGSVLLNEFEPRAARTAFEAVYRKASRTDVDLIGRSLYGIAQAAELAGDRVTATRFLRRTIEEARASRYARFAEIARSRIDGTSLPRVGSPAPSFGPRLDLDGKPRKSANLDRRTAFVVFCDGADPAERAELRRVLDAARSSGLDNEQIVVFALSNDRQALTRAVRDEQWSMPVLPCAGEFLDQDVLRFGVQELPATFLIGANGSLLARDLTARRLREVLTR